MWKALGGRLWYWCGLVLLLAGCAATSTSPATVPSAGPTRIERTREAIRSSPVVSEVVSPPVSPIAATTPPRPSPPPGTPRASPVTNNRPTVLPNLSGPVTVIAWSPDGTRFATSSGSPPDTNDSTIRLWSPTGALLATLEGHTAAVTSLAWSPDGSALASGSLDTTVRLWSASGDAARTLSTAEPPGRVMSLAWSPDGATLAVGTIGIPGGLAGAVRLYRPDGVLLAELRTRLAGNSYLMTGGKFLNLAWSPDGRLLAAGAVDYAIWRADGTQVASIYSGGTPAWGMAWSPDGRRLAIGDENGTVALYDSAGQGIAIWHNNGPVGGLGSLAFSPDGANLAVGASTAVSLLRVADPRAAPLVLQTGTAANVAWSPDGGMLAVANPATGATDAAVRLWRADGELAITLSGCTGPLQVLAWSADGKTLVAGSGDNRVCVWQIR